MATAEVVEPIRATKLSDLAFGGVVVERDSGGAVRVPADSSGVVHSGSARPQCRAGGCETHPARFRVSGEADRVYRIHAPAAVTATGALTGASLAVTDLTIRSDNAPDLAAGGRLDAEGRDRFALGGTLAVPAGTRPDYFRADIAVTVSYD
ncbi:DUF4402 domain-containing protein [Aurantiacibacter spongiae]|uniref:DUF4402 domain-containing protein n=1 Tax=Aurantiacibacter spongiae TaxID=2488860 RepID=UPI001315A0B3|nr:DUF4402 domain-containing protein [Aurantiacibacter spongiae]